MNRRYLIAAVLAVVIPLLAISYGCSGSGENRDAAVASALATYLGTGEKSIVAATRSSPKTGWTFSRVWSILRTIHTLLRHGT
jgi:hypothetical protein